MRTGGKKRLRRGANGGGGGGTRRGEVRGRGRGQSSWRAGSLEAGVHGSRGESHVAVTAARPCNDGPLIGSGGSDR
eukprot:2400707-Rhodomonas_salina.2